MTAPLWTPDPAKAASSSMSRFMNRVFQLGLIPECTWDSLYRWSVDRIEEFWPLLWEETGVLSAQKWDTVLSERKMPGARWFEGAYLNFAENLLKYRDDHAALVSMDEQGKTRRISYRELHSLAMKCAAALKAAGVQPGDRVAGFLPNVPQAVIAMLGATAIGAVWSSCSPDFGIKGVLDRFGQIEPKVLFTADAYRYNGKVFDSMGRIADLLANGLSSVCQLVVVPFVDPSPDVCALPRNAVLFDGFLETGDPAAVRFEQAPFDHPVYIMYSSGTTGVPKCIVHGAGGTLLQHLKELVLHTDLKREDTIFYFTTCGWMMWNWLVSSLAAGATVFLYDGSPSHPDIGALWRAAEEHGITVFGTSARYLAAVQQEGYSPREKHDLSKLRAVLSTGSPLMAEQFEWVYRDVKKDVMLSSIAGGTDIISCFMLGNPMLPVHASEIQCRGLGMDVQIWGDSKTPMVGEKGELVCVKPAPSMPVKFWNDPDGTKYFGAYFDVYPGVWRHGDWAMLTERGGIVMYGRSDATLNPGGVRIGTAEIYRAVDAMEEIADSLVIGRDVEGDVNVVLFVKIAQGFQFDDALAKKIRDTVRKQTTPRHVPREIHPVKDIPYTISGKKVELAVRNIIHKLEVKNRDALKNPESLDEYKAFAR